MNERAAGVSFIICAVIAKIAVAWISGRNYSPHLDDLSDWIELFWMFGVGYLLLAEVIRFWQYFQKRKSQP